MAILFADLIGHSFKFLNKGNIDLLFEPQFSPSSTALSYIRNDTENYAAPAAIPSD